MLQVFNTEKERETTKLKLTKIRHNDIYYKNGLTKPTENIINNRYELIHKTTDIYPIDKVQDVVEMISNYGSNIVDDKSGPRGTLPIPGQSDVVEYVTEEIVDYEDWMAGKTAALTGTGGAGTGGTIDPHVIDTNASHQSEIANLTSTSALGEVGLSYRVSSVDWDGNLGMAMLHPAILEGVRPENVHVSK